MASRRAYSRNRCFFFGCAAVTVVIIGLLIAIIVLAVRLKFCKECQESRSPSLRSAGLLEYFNLKDGLSLRWFLHANSQAELSDALTGYYDIIETDLLRTSFQTYREGITIHIEDWMRQVENSGKGVKLNIDPDSDPTAALNLAQKYKINAPVILSVPFPSNLSRFISAFSKHHWNFPLVASVDFTTTCCDDPIGIGSVEFLWEKFRTFQFPVNIEMEAKQWSSSWRNLQKLMDKSQNVSVLISSNQEVGRQALYDLLLVRNDIDRDRALYKINRTILMNFKDLVSTAGSPLLYFNIQPRNAGKIIWSHNTDTWELLNNAVNGPTMMVEADLRLQNGIPIMAHDLGDDNNLTFTQWLDEIIKVDKGMKLDFKELQAIGPVLDIVKNRKKEIKGPVWVNADIVKGPYGNDVTMTPNIFFDKIKAFPDVTLSVGWTTLPRVPNTNLNYTMDMAREMYNICKNLMQPITFPVRANMLRASWDVFQWLLQQSRDYTITVWTSPDDDVTKEDMDYIQRQSEAARVYFDLPKMLRPSFE